MPRDGGTPRARRIDRALAALRDALVDDDPPTSPSRWMRIGSSPEPKLARRWVRAGLLPSAKPSRDLLVDREVHDRLIAEHAHATAKPANDGDLDESILRAGGAR